MSTTGSIGGERTVLAAATWTSLASVVASLGNNVRIRTPLTDVRAILAASGVTPSGGGSGIAVTADKAMSVVIGKGITDVLWVYSTLGGNVYLQNDGTNDLLMVDSVTDALILAAISEETVTANLTDAAVTAHLTEAAVTTNLADAAVTAHLTDAAVTTHLTVAAVAGVATLDFNFGVQPAADVGVAGTGTTATHFTCDGKNFVTKLTVAGVMPAIVGGTNLGVGLLAFTFPAGVHMLKVARIALDLQQTQGNVTSDTPELSLGSVIVVGAVVTMTTGDWEDILTAQVMNDCDGAVEEKTLLVPTAGHLVNESGGVKAVFINIADAWANSGDSALGVNGEIWLEWTRFSS